MSSSASLKKDRPRNYFSLHRRLFKILGISFSQTDSRAYLIYSTIFLACTTFTYPLVQFAEFFKFYDNLDIFSVIFGYTSIMMLGMVKAFVLLKNRKLIGRTLDMLEVDVFAPNSEKGGPQETIWITRCIKLLRTQSLLYFGGVCLTQLFGVIGAITRRIKSDDYRDWTFPTGYFSLLDVSHSPNFEIICVYQTFGVTVCFGMVTVCDTLIASILAHIATQCRILQNRILLMVDNAHKRMIQDIPTHSRDTVDPSKIPWKYLHEELKEIVINHTKVINLAETFEDIFSYLVLMQFINTSCTLCVTMYYVSLFPITNYKFIQYMIGAVDLAIQVLFYCYWGNEVFLESLAIADACNKANFVGTDIRFQKGLYLIMLRSQRPIELTAGKFIGLSLVAYVWIIRSSYSYFMVIRSYGN